MDILQLVELEKKMIDLEIEKKQIEKSLGESYTGQIESENYNEYLKNKLRLYHMEIMDEVIALELSCGQFEKKISPHLINFAEYLWNGAMTQTSFIELSRYYKEFYKQPNKQEILNKEREIEYIDVDFTRGEQFSKLYDEIDVLSPYEGTKKTVDFIMDILRKNYNISNLETTFKNFYKILNEMEKDPEMGSDASKIMLEHIEKLDNLINKIKKRLEEENF